ncbi:MAG: SusC/RagA family TonB-linked outer membrane protein [Bacteroidales bacterium]
MPLPGVSISLKGANTGVITDTDGRYSIGVANNNAVLVFSYIGFASQEIAVGAQTRIDVVLSESAQALEEVVIVGYGVQKKANLSGAVQAVSSKDITNRPVTNANQALQGLAANVNITQLSGRATNAADINIRGFTSINGGNALILLDNVSVTADELSRINPEDIENVSVLKDAASAAIYGGRASFGVILITTKQARNSKLEVTADGSYGFRTFAYLPQLITDVYEHMTLANPSSTRSPLFTAEELEYGRLRSEQPDKYPAIVINRRQGLYNAGDWAYWDNIDWNNALLRDVSPTYSGNVRIANRNDKMSYTVSGGYFKQNGMMRYGNDTYDRFNLRGNGSYNLTSRWQLGTNLSFNYSEYDMPEGGNDIYFWQVSRNPLRSLYNPDGTYTVAGAYLIGLPKEGGRSVTKTNETQLSLNTTIDVIKDVWFVKADANFRFTNGLTRASHFPVLYRTGPDKPFSQVVTDTGDRALSQSIFASSESELTNYQVYNVYTDYHQTFGGKHYVQAMIGFNQESMNYTYSLIRKNDLISQSLPTIQLATGSTVSKETINTLALRGAFGRLNYIFDNKYIVEFNGRYDGTSRFPKNSRFGFFPSGSAGWVISREHFFESVANALRIDQLKLRGSYGALGNQVQKTNDNSVWKDVYYPYIATMTAQNISVPVNGALPLAVLQPGVVAGSLTWERVRTINGGFDLSLLDNRFTLSADFYTRYTEGMLVQGKDLPVVFGADPPKENAGDLKTKGWEIVVGYNDSYQVGGSPLRVGLNFMLADARSYITKYDNPTRRIDRSGISNYYEGQELGEIWGFVTDGYLTKDDLVLNADGTPSGKSKIDQYQVAEDDNSRTVYEGDLKFKDLNGDGAITWGTETVDDPGDRRIIGNETTRLPYSFTIDASWKGFDLRAFFQGVGKRDWYPMYNYHDFWGIYGNPWSSAIVANRDHWTPENPDAYFPRLKPYIAESYLELGVPQTKYLQDASYLRFKNLTIGYTLPAALTGKWHIERLRFHISAENLITWNHLKVDGIDPELINVDRSKLVNNGLYPLQKVYSAGFNLTF